MLRVTAVSFFAEGVATTGFPVEATVLVPGVDTAAGVAFATVGPGPLGAGAGFFEAIVPAAVAVATAGPGDVAGADFVTSAGVADAHGSAGCAPGCGCAFL